MASTSPMFKRTSRSSRAIPLIVFNLHMLSYIRIKLHPYRRYIALVGIRDNEGGYSIHHLWDGSLQAALHYYAEALDPLPDLI